MRTTIRKLVSLIAQHINPDVEVHKIRFDGSDILHDFPLSKPKPLVSSIELQHYRENCPNNCHPVGDCDNYCHASDYYYRKYPDGVVRGQWYCKASPTLEEFEPDYRKKARADKE
jgi:hypothetical protein